jgi:hypothetical protein
MIRMNNGAEYVNKEFGAFLSVQGILHQTSCLDTPPQNGVAERKNRHISEVARSLMYTMNVTKYLWSEVVMTVTYLINRTMKTPCEMLLGENKFVVPPKVFGFTCFVRDRAVKRIFIGYPSEGLQVLESCRATNICEHGCDIQRVRVVLWREDRS